MALNIACKTPVGSQAQRRTCGRQTTASVYSVARPARSLSSIKSISPAFFKCRAAHPSHVRLSTKQLQTRAEEEDPPPSMMVIAPFQSAINALLQRRIIRLGGEVNDDMANCIVAQLLYLDAKDPEEDITIYINSPGGSVTAGMAIFDTMRHVKANVSTVCVGQAASMGAFLLSAGTPGKRYCMPNARVMIHQPLGGAKGQATDLYIQSMEMMHHKETLTQYLADFCGKTYEEMKADTDRDFFLGANESVEYGIVDSVLPMPKWETGAATVDMDMYDFAAYDWRELPTLDPEHPANKNLEMEKDAGSKLPGSA